MQPKKENEDPLFKHSAGGVSGENSLFSAIGGGNPFPASPPPPPSPPPPALKPAPPFEKKEFQPPPPPPPPPGLKKQEPWEAVAGELASRLKELEQSNSELKGLASDLAGEIRGLRESSARDERALSGFCSAVEALKSDFSKVYGVFGGEKSELEKVMRSADEDRKLRDSSIAGLKEDLSALRAALKSVSVYGSGIERKLEETGKKYAEVETRLARTESVSDRIRDFESGVRVAHLSEEKCAHLSGRLEGLEKRVSDLLGAYNCDADRLSAFCGRLGEMQSRIDQLSAMFEYFRDMVEKMRRTRPVEAAQPPREIYHSPDQEICALINRIH